MAYLYFIWKFHRSFLIFSALVISVFQFLFLKLVTTIDYPAVASYLLDQLPGNIQAMFGENFLSMRTVEGAAAFGLNHPLVLVILFIGAIIIPSRHIAGEAETGTLELVLSFPIARTRLLLNLWISALSFLFFIVFLVISSSVVSITIFHRLTADLFVKMVTIGCNLWLLSAFVMSLALVLSSFGKEGNLAAIRAAGITLVFYLLHYLSSLWDTIAFTKPFNFFTYYQPEDLMTGEGSFSLHFTVLFFLILICLLVSLFQFNRRDIPG
jgi:ABC-type transport system involved in multi-copper enzyme maturation permease subunit